MKRLITASCLAALALTASAQTPDATPAKTTKAAKTTKTGQQSKMGQCNAQAKADGKKGDDRKAFMKQCLSKKPTSSSGQ